MCGSCQDRPLGQNSQIGDQDNIRVVYDGGASLALSPCAAIEGCAEQQLPGAPGWQVMLGAFTPARGMDS